MAERVEKPPEGLPEGGQSGETYKTPDPRAHYVELDALRGIAILAVVVCHVANFWENTTQIPLYVPLFGVDLIKLLVLGYLGVPLFFLLSGYLLTWTEEKRRRRGTYSVLNYAKRRALRLVPAYYVAIAVVVLVLPTVLGQPIAASFGSVALHLTFLHDFKLSYPEGLDPAWWSLTPEVVFYVMLPFLVLKFRKFSQRAAIFGLLLLVSLATRILMAYDVFSILLPSMGEALDQNRMSFFPTTLLYLFLVGVLLRMMVEHRTNAGREPGYRQLLAASALTVISVAVMLVFPYLVMIPTAIRSNLAETMVVLFFASALLGSPVLKPVLRWRPLVFFGTISYSLFLLHVTVIVVLITYLGPALGAWAPNQGEPIMAWAAFLAYASAVLAVAGALAYLSYRYVESPFLRIKPK